ncbi:MAG: hypothetical protein HOP34_17225 [Methylococcaceae bacterium]|nr:hypothetical protein [Methylococcaceae bacterium]
MALGLCNAGFLKQVHGFFAPRTAAVVGPRLRGPASVPTPDTHFLSKI